MSCTSAYARMRGLGEIGTSIGFNLGLINCEDGGCFPSS